jgi:ribosomal protein S17E
VFKNRVLRRIWGPKRNEVTGYLGKLHNKELHNLYSSPDIIRMIKSRGMRWTGYVTRMRAKKNAYKILQNVGGWTIIKWRDRMGWYGLDRTRSG